eukprot:2491742-Pyramimonas_sp.AAC.1
MNCKPVRRRFGAPWGAIRGLLGASWGLLGASWGPLQAPGDLLGLRGRNVGSDPPSEHVLEPS